MNPVHMCPNASKTNNACIHAFCKTCYKEFLLDNAAFARDTYTDDDNKVNGKQKRQDNVVQI